MSRSGSGGRALAVGVSARMGLAYRGGLNQEQKEGESTNYADFTDGRICVICGLMQLVFWLVALAALLAHVTGLIGQIAELVVVGDLRDLLLLLDLVDLDAQHVNLLLKHP